MGERKFLNIVLLSFSFVMAINGLAFAGQECTHQAVRSDGTTIISTDCSSSSMQTEQPGAENFWNRYFFGALVNNLMSSISSGIQNLKDQYAKIFLAEAHSKQVAADARAKEQEAIEAQQSKHQEQEMQLEDLKERQDIQKQQQQDSRQASSYKQ